MMDILLQYLSQYFVKITGNFNLLNLTFNSFNQGKRSVAYSMIKGKTITLSILDLRVRHCKKIIKQKLLWSMELNLLAKCINIHVHRSPLAAAYGQPDLRRRATESRKQSISNIHTFSTPKKYNFYHLSSIQIQWGHSHITKETKNNHVYHDILRFNQICAYFLGLCTTFWRISNHRWKNAAIVTQRYRRWRLTKVEQESSQPVILFDRTLQMTTCQWVVRKETVFTWMSTTNQ